MTIIIRGKKTITVSRESPVSVVDLLRQNGCSFSMPCGGNHTCGKCRVRVQGSVSPKTERERKLLCDAAEDVRLACFATITGDCEIFVNDDALQMVSEGLVSDFAFDPIGKQYGFAVDIGTTTVAVTLYDLKHNRKVGERVFFNPQSIFGADVIARMEAAVNGKSLQLQQRIAKKLTEVFTEMCEGHGIEKENADAAVITGNTAMLYLLLKKGVSCLASAPFAITDFLGKQVKPQECGIMGFPKMSVYLPRTVSAFVGSDITCSMLAVSDWMESASASVLIDIGTNGEIVMKKGDESVCCSTAAGPALEGANIAMGSMAIPGAVNRVWMEDKEICYTTIHHDPAIGICGSGLIDAIAMFLQCGLIDESGRINEKISDYSQYISEYDGQSALKIGESGMVLTQKDIRAVQLAKAAIRAGMETLFHTCETSADEMERLILAGGFGSYIDPVSAGEIGLIPKELVSKTKAVGNAAGTGVLAILLSQTAKSRAIYLAERAQTIELSTSSFFLDSFVEHMAFTRNQLEEDYAAEQISIKEFTDPFTGNKKQ